MQIDKLKELWDKLHENIVDAPMLFAASKRGVKWNDIWIDVEVGGHFGITAYVSFFVKLF